MGLPISPESSACLAVRFRQLGDKMKDAAAQTEISPGAAHGDRKSARQARNVGDVAYAADGDHLVDVPDRPPTQLSRLRRIL